MKRVFITGAAGFIGFHMAAHLAARGDHVAGLDNFNPYYDPALKRARAKELKEKWGVEIVDADMCDRASLQKAIETHNTTHILHLGAQAGVRYSLEAPEAYLKSNVDAFLNILEICRAAKNIPLVYASSSSVYGRNTKVPFSVTDKTDDPASFYGVTKKSNELMATAYHHLFGIAVTGLRYFTVYGPWGRPDMAYYSFTKAILEGRPISIYNNGKMERDFTYIDDIAQGTTAALDHAHTYPCALFNLGNHKPEKLLTLVALLERELGKQAEKLFLPMQAGDVVATYACIKESEEKLGFMPRVGLEEGVKRFVEWYRGYKSRVQ